MLTFDLSRCRIEPYQHQKEGIERIVNQPHFALFDEMGAGKTKQVIDAAQILYLQGLINHVIVIAPASVRSVWFDPDLGELKKHIWEGMSISVLEFHKKPRMWNTATHGRRLMWTITNYDWIRKEQHLEEVLKFCDKSTMLVLDESSAIKSFKAKQTKACSMIRKECGRVVLLNGTPIANNPGDLYTQSAIMDPKILECRNYFHFRARYGVMGGYMGKKVVKWINLDDLQSRLKPHVLRRLKSECLDLPEKLPSSVITVPLTPQSWNLYKEMRSEFVAWLDSSTVTTAAQAVVKALRLAQITSGFIGGIEAALPDEDSSTPPVYETREVGREKLDLFLAWLKDQFDVDPNLKLLVWCRFRPELQRLLNSIAGEYGTGLTGISLGAIWGGQSREDRERATRLLDPRTAPEGPCVVLGTPSSGSMGLNLTAAHTVVYLSNDYSLKTRLQSEDRVHRPGQHSPVSYFDFVATGPDGQKTIDHSIIKVLRSKEEIANWTTQAWIREISEE